MIAAKIVNFTKDLPNNRLLLQSLLCLKSIFLQDCLSFKRAFARSGGKIDH